MKDESRSRGRRKTGELPPDFEGFPARLRAAVAAVALEYQVPRRAQAKIAARCGVNKGSLSQWLHDKAWEGITVPVMIRLADGLGVDYQWLSRGSGPPVWVRKPEPDRKLATG